MEAQRRNTKGEWINSGVTIPQISNLGVLIIRFEEDLQLPEDFKQLVRDSQGTDDAILEIFMVEPGN